MTLKPTRLEYLAEVEDGYKVQVVAEYDDEWGSIHRALANAHMAEIARITGGPR